MAKVGLFRTESDFQYPKVFLKMRPARASAGQLLKNQYLCTSELYVLIFQMPVNDYQ
jgi:hypothetical protein